MRSAQPTRLPQPNFEFESLKIADFYANSWSINSGKDCKKHFPCGLRIIQPWSSNDPELS